MGLFDKIKQVLGLEEKQPAKFEAPVRLSPDERAAARKERESFITNLDIISDRDGTLLTKDYDFNTKKLTSTLNIELFEALDHARKSGLKIAIATGGEPSINEFKEGLGKSISKELLQRVDEFLQEVPIISKGDIHLKMQQKEGAFHIDDASSFIDAPNKGDLHDKGMSSNHIFPQFIDAIKARIEEQIKAKNTPDNNITQSDKNANPANKPRNNEQDKGTTPSH
jgi:hypothetical protein